MEKGTHRFPRVLVVLLIVILTVFVAIPLAISALSLIGTIDGDLIFPGDPEAFVRVPHTVTTVERVLVHQPLSEILADPSFATLASTAATLRELSARLPGPVRTLLNGSSDAALYRDGTVLVAYDAGFLSPWLKATPFIVSRLDIKGLYYVNAGNRSRFEYRSKDGTTLYLGFMKNLLVASNNEATFEATVSNPPGTGPFTDGSELTSLGVARNRLDGRSYDIGLLVSSDFAVTALGEGNRSVSAFLDGLSFPGFADVTVAFQENRVVISLTTPVTSRKPELTALLAREPRLPRVLSRLPADTQYCTIVSAGDARSLLSATTAVSGQSVADAYEEANDAARSYLGRDLDSLVFSWTADEFAAFGLEGRPKPVFAVRIADEAKRREAFDALFSSILIDEDSSTVIDGVRLPRVVLPSFIDFLARAMGVVVPSPYYVIEDGILFLSESPENLLVTVTSIKKNNLLVKVDAWKSLAESGNDRAQLSLFYSLDRTVPFFLKGTTPFHRALQLYRQGLLRVAVTDGLLEATLTATPGSGSGIALIPGFPIDAGGRLSKELSLVKLSAKADSRLLFVTDDRVAVSYNPRTGLSRKLEANDPVWIRADPFFKPASRRDDEVGAESAKREAAAWVVSSSGEVNLVTADLESLPGFPIATGIRPTAEPVSFEGTVYLCDRDSTLHAVKRDGTVTVASLPFTEPVRSPPVFLRSGKKTLMATYPKSFLGAIWLTDTAGAPEPDWPAYANGIAYGSPLPFIHEGKTLVAFVTQAGELAVFGQDAKPLPGFPVALSGVFYAQPAFDGDSLWLVSAAGTLFRVSLDGAVLSHQIPEFTAEEGLVTLHDVTGDDKAEIFITGDGSALHGYSRDFVPLAGFPLPLWGSPVFADSNGDGRIDCLGTGLDNRIHGWQFR